MDLLFGAVRQSAPAGVPDLAYGVVVNRDPLLETLLRERTETQSRTQVGPRYGPMGESPVGVSVQEAVDGFEIHKTNRPRPNHPLQAGVAAPFQNLAFGKDSVTGGNGQPVVRLPDDFDRQFVA